MNDIIGINANNGRTAGGSRTAPTRGVTIVRIGSSSYLRISGNDTWNAGTVTVAVGLSALPKLLETRTQ